jgi:hypothetical protein
MAADSITLLHSCRVSADGEVEPGRTCWFRDYSAAVAWLLEEGDPCEHRWTYVVLMSAGEGMRWSSGAQSWWRAVYDDDVLAGFERCVSPLPVGTDVAAIGVVVDTVLSVGNAPTLSDKS